MSRTPIFRKAAYLEYGTIGWGLAAAMTALVAGIAAGSIALLSFGLGSVLMTVSPGLVAWRMLLELRGEKIGEDHMLLERKVLFMVGVIFFLLALYLLNESGSRLYYREKPEASAVGFIVASLSLVALPALAVMKFRTARALEHAALRADVMETVFGAYLALVLFLGLGFHAWAGWWWADSAAALLMLPILARGGWDAIEVSKGNTGYRAEKTGPERNI